MAPAIPMPIYASANPPLEFAALSPDQLQDLLSKQYGLHTFLMEHARSYVTSGKRPNLPGWVLYLFEHDGRDTTLPVLCANGDLSERSALTGLTKLNEILYPTFRLKIERVKDSGGVFTSRIRLSSVDDAKAATDEFLDKFRKAQREFGRTYDAFAQLDPERARLLMDQAIAQRLAAGVMDTREAEDINSFRRALAPSSAN